MYPDENCIFYVRGCSARRGAGGHVPGKPGTAGHASFQERIYPHDAEVRLHFPIIIKLLTYQSLYL